MKRDPYVEYLVSRWRLIRSPAVATCVRRVLGEMVAAALLDLRDERLQVILWDEPYGMDAWAYFPIHRRRLIARHPAVQRVLKPTTRILFTLRKRAFGTMPARKMDAMLRDQFGHILLYLKNPHAPNDCPEAMKQWRRSCK
jgi:hypothetical protein